MRLVIRTRWNKTVTLEADPDCTIGDLKQRIVAKEGIPPEQHKFVDDDNLTVDNMKLMLRSTEENKATMLDDSRTLAHYGIEDGATLNIVVRLRH